MNKKLFIAVLLTGGGGGTSAAVCDWSGYNDWVHGWEHVSCSDDIGSLDYLTLGGCIVLDFLGGSGACAAGWLKDKLEGIVGSVGMDILEDLIKGEVSVVDEVDIKAAAHSGTSCYHKWCSWCPKIPQPNRHRVCVAYRNSAYGTLSEEKVRQAYCRVLQRSGEESGVENWIGYLQSGRHTVKEMIKDAFLASGEFQGRFVHGQAPEEVVATLYEILHDRGVDPAGMGWSNVLRAEGFTAVVDGIMNSQEYMGRWGDHMVPGNGREGCT